MTRTDVLKMVKKEVLSIQARDGELGPSAYVWAEVRTRLSTLKAWDGLAPTRTIGEGLRELVEEVLTSMKPRNPCPKTKYAVV